MFQTGQGQDVVVSNLGCFQSAGVHANAQELLLSAESGYRVVPGPRSRRN